MSADRSSALSLFRRLDAFLAAGLLLVLADVALFHRGGYFLWLEPESYSGEVLKQARRLASSIETFPGRRRIVMMGDSLTGAGIQERQLEEELAERGSRYAAINLAIGGATSRSWYLLLKNGLAPADTTEIVVLGIHGGLLRATSDNLGLDLKIVKTHLRVTDAWPLASSYQGLEKRFEVFSGVVFRGLLFRDDLRQYLEEPGRRHRELAARRSAGEEHPARENRSKHDLLSARLGDDGRLVAGELAPFLRRRHQLRGRIERQLRRRADFRAGRGQAGTRRPLDAGKVRSLERLVEVMHARGIRVVFSTLPRSPYPLRELDASVVERLAGDLARRGADVVLWHDAELIRRLESPEFFRDSQHLNAAGAEIYTRDLARFLAATIHQNWK